jgi:hypothetical protein
MPPLSTAIERVLGHYWLVGIGLFFACRILLGIVFDLSAECHDGWDSPSIGIRGACSHHGGVDRSAAEGAFLFSLLIGVVGGNIARLVSDRAESLDLPSGVGGFVQSVAPPARSTSADEDDASRPRPSAEELALLRAESEVRSRESAEFIAQQLAEIDDRQRARNKELRSRRSRSGRKRTGRSRRLQ